MHEDADTKLVALLVKDFLEHYKMDYTLSVYLPEVALQNGQNALPKSELASQCGLTVGDQPLLVQLLKQSRQ